MKAEQKLCRSGIMHFFRNRLVVLGLVLLATVLLYLLLPAIRQGSMEPFLNVQRMGLTGGSPTAPTARFPKPVNITIRTGQLAGDPPLFFRETISVDAAGKKMQPRLQVVLLHGQAFTSKTWEDLGTLTLLASHGYQALALDLPDSETMKTDQNRTNLLLRFLDSLGVQAPVLISPSMSGRFSLPLLMHHSSRLRGFVAVAPVGTKLYSEQQYHSIQTPTLIVFGALDGSLGTQSLKNLSQLPHHTVVRIDGAKHACYMDKPREFHQALLIFLSKLNRETRSQHGRKKEILSEEKK
ncbi:protein ABHD14A isoform X1 [Acipenser ruthenus]|uniref:protein ABHD14A isoform X1 n=2 Tax=Acipenser ruthenus TaxID=7906 RepID=UPI0027423E4F|nr:protein ABHD14A isoform X1 [Acipenser ruthenus]XP_033875715.3 protein ABHD14A isoform X1 [Acipenser ruthenus]XP_034775436.2 protein ABHD14A isoform X1 [Acipenser ruthenus]XP_058855906.1 protein ABHD14A isoform X1 [Acipenser ruthenus]